MDGGGQNNNPRTVEEVFRDFRGRRAGLIKALTTDIAEFYQQCDPEKENLCLFGFPGEQWEVNLPAQEVPPELPEPVIGINFARDGMLERDWITLVAVHSDAWLLAVAFYFGARFGFDKAERDRLFNMINDLPTLFQVVTGTGNKKQSREKQVSKPSSNQSNASSKGDWCTLTLGTALMAYMAFQLAITPPLHNVGSREVLYKTYHIAELVAFFASLSIIPIVMSGLPVEKRLWMWIQKVAILIAGSALMIAFFTYVCIRMG